MRQPKWKRWATRWHLLKYLPLEGEFNRFRVGKPEVVHRAIGAGDLMAELVEG